MKKVITLCLLSAVLFGFVSCGSTNGVITVYFDPDLTEEELETKTQEIKEKYSYKSFDDEIEAGIALPPEKGVLIFGTGLFGPVMLQQNPKIGYQFYNSASSTKSGFLGLGAYDVFCFKPIPAGSEVKFYSSQTISGRTITTHYYGISGVDLKTVKPGLYYFGVNDEEKKYEKKALEYAKEFCEGTEWESVIDARIKELKDEN